MIQVIVEGAFNVTATAEEIAYQGAIAEYSVRIIFYQRYPDIEPTVFELDNAFPRNPAFHVNPNGTCCVNVWEAWLATRNDASIKAYFDGPLKNFFLSQHVKKTTGKWPFDELAHGSDGLLDAYAEILDCPRNKGKVRYFLRVLSKDWPKGHWAFPCGSRKIIRKCCAATLAELHDAVSPKMARRMLTRLD